MLIGVARLILILVPIVNVFWVPIFSSGIGGGANATYLDLMLSVAWILSGIYLVRNTKLLTQQDRVAWSIVFLVNLPLLLSPTASYLISDGGNLVGGILVHLKRIGLASILVPLAVLADFQRLRRWLVLATCLAAAILYFGPPGWIELNREALVSTFGGRNVSLVFNPNTLSFMASINFLILVVLFEVEESVLIRGLIIFCIGLSIITLGSAASRAGTIGLFIGLMYYVLRRGSWYGAAIVVSGILMSIWLVSSEQFQGSLFASRWELVLTEGLQEQNISGRLIQQRMALTSVLDHPIGVGIGLNIPTDSIYLDYLSAMGYLGTITLIILFVTIWRSQPPNTTESILARSVLLNVFVFSFSGLGLASPFVSPLFFLVIGLGLSSQLLRQKRFPHKYKMVRGVVTESPVAVTSNP